MNPIGLGGGQMSFGASRRQNVKSSNTLYLQNLNSTAAHECMVEEPNVE